MREWSGNDCWRMGRLPPSSSPLHTHLFPSSYAAPLPRSSSSTSSLSPPPPPPASLHHTSLPPSIHPRVIIRLTTPSSPPTTHHHPPSSSTHSSASSSSSALPLIPILIVSGRFSVTGGALWTALPVPWIHSGNARAMDPSHRREVRCHSDTYCTSRSLLCLPCCR